MNLTVSVLLLVAVCYAAEVAGRPEDEGNASNQELQGNFGLKILPSTDGASPQNPEVQYDDNNNDLREQGTPQVDYGLPNQPVAKISDVLAGQGPSFPAAIEGHLYSPVQVYQPRLGSPTTFEVSQPVPSQLAYSEHNIYQGNQNIQNLNENLQPINQPPQPPYQPPQNQFQFNLFPSFAQLQPPRAPSPALSTQFLPRLDRPRLPLRQDIPPHIYQQLFSSPSGIPQDIFQQINQLGNQLSYEETLQIAQDSEDDDNDNKDSDNAKEQEQNLGIQYANNLQQQDQKSDEQAKPSQQQPSEQQKANSQAVSYASFSQSFPTTYESQNQVEQVADASLSLQPNPQQQQEVNSQSQSTPLYESKQSKQGPSPFQPVGTTPTPTTTLFTVANQTPKPLGIVKIKQELTTPQTHTISSFETQDSTTSSVAVEANSQPYTIQEQPTTIFFSSPPPQLRPNFRPLPTLAPKTTLVPSTLRSRRPFALRPTRPTLTTLPVIPRRKLTTLHTVPTLPPTLAPLPVISQSLPTISQPIVKTVTSLPPPTIQPQFFQPTQTTLPILQRQPIQPQKLSSLQQLPQLTTSQPFVVTQSKPFPTIRQPSTIAIKPVLRTQYQMQPVPKPVIQIQKFKQQAQQQPLVQLIQQPQIQQQLQSIQQLQQIQQQPQLIQQQPQPVQIIQQQNPFPQPVQVVQQQQPIPQQIVQQRLQPVRVIQSQPQFIQQQPQVIQQQPQLILRQQQVIQHQQTEPLRQLQSEIHQNSQQNQQQDQNQPQNSKQSEKSHIKESENSQGSNEQADRYSQLLQNHVYSEELYVQPPHLHQIPVAFPPFHSRSPYPLQASSLHTPHIHPSLLHTSPFYPSPLHAPLPSVLHPSSFQASPSFHPHSFHGTSSYPAVQFFGKYAPGIFRGLR